MTRLFPALLGALLALPALAVSPEAAIAELERGLDAPLRRAGQPALPGLSAQMRAMQLRGYSIAVIHEGTIHWARGFGEARAGVPVTPETRFQAGSISKPVGALTALRFAAQQGVGVDADLRSQLRSWSPPDDPQAAARYTLRRLLSHSAGLGQHGFPGYPREGVLPSTAQILDGLPPANTGAVRAVQAPGEGFRYSGGGSTVVQQWLEDQSGKPYAQLAQQLVLQPLGMAHSQAHPPGDDTGFAHSHQRGVAEPGGFRRYPEGIAAGLWSTPSDLARLLIAVQDARAGRPSPIEAEVARSATARVLGPTSMGFFVEEKSFGHNGSNQGFESMASAALDGRNGFVLMANGNGSWQLMDGVARTLARVYGWKEREAPLALANQKAPAAWKRHEGDYGSWRVRWADNALWWAMGPGGWQRLWITGPEQFALDSGDRLRFEGSTLITPQGSLPRAEPAPPPAWTPYFRGSVNNWTATQALRRVGKGRWQIELALPAGKQEFKIGDPEWNTVNLGGGGQVAPGTWQVLSARGGNLLLDLPTAGRYRVELELDDSPRPARLRLTKR